MKLLAQVALVAVLAAALVAPAFAADAVTLQGKVLCAKCALKKDGFKECQNVLLVPEKGKDGAARDAEYYIVNNDVNKEFGEVCMDAKKATVTGTVSEKDGLKWIAPSKMEPAPAEDAH
jgi:hypothetical protein